MINDFLKIQANYKIKDQKWIKELRSKGIKACHPNDGWVDRKRNRIHLAYPLFNDGLNVGDKIMLGWATDPGSHRLVRVTKIESSLLLYYHFEDVNKAAAGA